MIKSATSTEHMFCYVVYQAVDRRAIKTFWESPCDEVLQYLYRLVQLDYHLVLGAGISTFHRVLSFCVGTTDPRSLETRVSRTTRPADDTTVDFVRGCWFRGFGSLSLFKYVHLRVVCSYR